MSAKAEWRPFDWSKAQFPEREGDYHEYRELVAPDGTVLASIECFASYPTVFYANIWEPERIRGGPIGNEKQAIAWCEHKAGNKVN